MVGFTLEKRTLKRPRLGPPDVYPQDPKQKEDELTAVNVKQGFTHTPLLTDEFGSAKSCNLTASKVSVFFNNVLNKKRELNTLPDTGRKRQQINSKDNFWPVTGRSKNAVEAWFKDLAGSKPLTSLAKKVPIFNKKEEIFMTLCDYQVPMLRAAWFLKMTSAYTVAISEAKIKKRQLPDPSQEWTQTLIKFLKDQLQKLQEYYHTPHPGGTPGFNSSGFSSSTSGTSPSSLLNSVCLSNEDHKLALKLWQYFMQFSKHLYEEGLLDRQEFLQWILDLMEKTRSPDDGILRLLLPLAVQFVDEFVLSELLSRKLAYYCAKKLSLLLADASNGQNPSPLLSGNSNGNIVCQGSNQMPMNPLAVTIGEYMGCPLHRSTILGFSTILQVITLECSTALVWSNVGEGKSLSVLNGSPLDLLPCPPSTLPMPIRPNNAQIRTRLRVAEEHVRHRGRAAEAHWSCDKWQQSTAGTTIYKVLNALDALDRHCFDRVDSNNSIDTLYSKVFHTAPSKDNNVEVIGQDEPIVQLLCEWAASAQRSGEHRAMAVAKLLEKRQADLTVGEPDIGDEKDSVSSTAAGSSGLPLFQSLLMKFLDTDAPVLEDNSTLQNRTTFTNLVHLFAELVRHDVFSHDAYMCTLISRGDLLSGPGPALVKPATPGVCDMRTEDHGRSQDYDDSKIDDDLDKLLQHIKEEQQNSMDIPDSPKDDIQSSFHGVAAITAALEEKMDSREIKRQSRHLLFTTHFPLPQDDSCTHESNQRHVLLYGVGRARDDARHVVKKISKEIYKLFSKKFSIDVAEGGKVKKHSKGEFNFEATMQKMQSLSYFDQHVVTMQCASAVIEMLNSFATGGSNYLPVQEHISFLFELMELALNIHGLIDTCIQMLKELPEVEAQLVQKGSGLIRAYTTSVSLYIVGVLRRYHCCLLLSQEQTASVFEGLCKVVKHVSNPSDCTSAERCILAHLYDLYTSCSFLKSKHYEARCEPFANAYPKIKQTLYSMVQPTFSNCVWNAQFMADYIANPRKKIELQYIKQLNENAGNRYSFVCNAIMSVCNETDNDKLNDLAILCAELTACCNSLSSEWLGVLTVLCPSTNRTPYFIDVLSQVDVQDLSIHNSLAIFTSILIARHCFSLQDFVVHVAVPSLLKAWNEGHGDADGEGEAGARLTCHLLLRLFKTVEGPQPSMYSISTSPHPLTNSSHQHFIKLSCDRHLLAAAHNNITVGAVLAALKAILVLKDVSVGDSKAKKDHAKTGVGELSISHILGTSDISGGTDDPLLDLGLSLGKTGTSGLEGASLSKFAKHALQQICSQEWVHERSLQNPEELCKQDMLLDSMLTPKQAQRLLHMICYPENAATLDESLDQRQWIARILENLDQWMLRVSWLDLQLMYKQFSPGSAELNQWLDMVAKATLDVFQLTNEEPDSSGRRGTGKGEVKSASPPRPKVDKEKCGSIWLVAPLVSKLPSSVQGRVLKMAGQVLESGNWSSSRGRDKDRSVQRSSSLLSHQPFLSLVLTCLKGQDDQREGLLTSLHSQLSQFLFLSKDEKLYNYDDLKARQMMQDALLLRFSLVGGMFDTIQRNTATTTDWALLLVTLVSHGVIDLNNNSELFTTVLDMLATLIHSTLACDVQSEKEENKKYYQNLMKKLKKELADKTSASIKHIRQLLPLPKQQSEVIACEPVGCLTDTKGNKITGFDSIDKKQGLQVAEKQRVAPWDLLEGHKNPAPLSWSWFGAVRMERKPLKYEESHRLQRYHTHSMIKPTAHYLEPPPLPPEDLEPPPEKQPKEEVKADTPNSDQSPRGAKRQKTQRKRRQKAGVINNQNMLNNMTAPPVQHIGYQNQGMYPSQPQWGYGQQQPPYYSQQIAPVGGPRLNQSKQALSNMLRSRNPPPQFLGPQQPPFQSVPRQQFIRQQMRVQPNPGMQPAQQGMFPQQMQQQVSQGVNQNTMYPGMQQGMNQGYSGYSPQPGMVQQQPMLAQQQQGQPMMSHGFGQSGFPQQGMMGMQRQQDPASYMQQTMMQQRPMNQPTRPAYMQAPNVTMGSLGPLAQQQGYGRPVQQSVQQSVPQAMQPAAAQQFQQARIRQQMLAMQPPQPHPQAHSQGHPQGHPQAQGQQGQTPALVTHLQRQLSGGQQIGQQMGQQMPQQHNPYHQY